MSSAIGLRLSPVDLTPMRIRGKRNVARSEKPPRLRRKVRNAHLEVSSIQDGEAHPRKRRRREPLLSRLETLPTEILQTIFLDAANIHLALASPNLSAQLSGKHLHTVMMDHVLGRVLDSDAQKPEERCLIDAVRLLNCRFVTWPVFNAWLSEYRQSTGLEEATMYSLPHRLARTLWLDLKPSTHLLPPRKLLQGPWTEEKCHLLDVLSSQVVSPAALDLISGEMANAGLRQAVAEGSERAVKLLLRMTLDVETDIVRLAVIDSGCAWGVVSELLAYTGGTTSVDWLDRDLWTWAEKAKIGGDVKGPWLMKLLKQCARRVRHGDALQHSPI